MRITANRWIGSATAVFVLMLFAIIPVSAEDNPPDAVPDLFSENSPTNAPAAADDSTPPHPEVIRQRSAEVDFSILADLGRAAPRPDQPVFTLNFFEDAQFTAYITKTEIFPSGAVGLVGHVDSDQYNELVMVSHQGLLQAYLQVGAQMFEIRATGDGHLIVEVDQSAYPDSLPPRTPPEAAGQAAANPMIGEDTADFIDVLAVYTPAAVSYLGGKLFVEARIQQSILSANQGYAASGVNQQLRLVAMKQVNYDENPSDVTLTDRWYYALDRLTFGTAYSGDSIHLADARAYREQYGADLVFMVTNLPSIYCGLGWVAGGSSDAAYGYSVLHANCTGSGSYTPQHEMGHNMGACHDWNNTDINFRQYCWDDYAYGYQSPNQFYTVMAYSYGCGACTRINRWSNPDQYYLGNRLSGLVSGQTVLPDNRLTLNNTAINVANFRQSIISPISGSFLNPSDDNRVHWPRTTLAFAPASTEGTITSVRFHAYYDGSWTFLGEDTNGADGWTTFWNSAGISQQAIKVRAVVTDSAANQEIIVKDGLTLTGAMLTGSGYDSRGGGGDGPMASPPDPVEPAISVNPAVPVEPAASVEPAPAPIKEPPASVPQAPAEPDAPPPVESPKPALVIPEPPPPPALHYHQLVSQLMMLE
ncbi:MAG: M12 family metallo-peptidase [Anaerolineales bacterium]